MKKVALIVVCFIVYGCVKYSPVLNQVQRIATEFGLRWLKVENGWKIVYVTPGDPADRSGLLVGDIIKEINGMKVGERTHKELINYTRSLPLKKKAIFLIKRFGELKEIEIYPREKKQYVKQENSPNEKIFEMLADGKDVCLVIMVGDVSVVEDNPWVPLAEQEQGRVAITNEILAIDEQDYLLYKCYPKFKLVDRNQISTTLDELHFQSTGMVSGAMRLKIGDLTGATNILYITLSFWSSYAQKTSKLIDIGKGEIIGLFITEVEY